MATTFRILLPAALGAALALTLPAAQAAGPAVEAAADEGAAFEASARYELRLPQAGFGLRPSAADGRAALPWGRTGHRALQARLDLPDRAALDPAIAADAEFGDSRQP